MTCEDANGGCSHIFDVDITDASSSIDSQLCKLHLANRNRSDRVEDA
jgi:hypothetical protein